LDRFGIPSELERNAMDASLRANLAEDQEAMLEWRTAFALHYEACRTSR
jgi:hypothetical protein